MPLFTGDQFTAQLDALTVGLSRVLFPIVILLGLNGLVVGILNAHDHFTIPALTPLVWNIVIIGGIVLLDPLFEGDDKLYAYAIGVVAGTAVQLAMCIPPLIRIGFPVRITFDFLHDEHVKRVLVLMLPGLDQPGPDQRQPRPELVDRLARQRGGAARDRRRVPHLHAPAGDVLRRRRDRALPGAQPAGEPPRPPGPARAHRHRHAPDRAAADPERGGDRRALRADGAARLPARRVRRELDGARVRGAVLVLVLARVQRHQPAADAHVLRAPGAVDADAARALVARR